MLIRITCLSTAAVLWAFGVFQGHAFASDGEPWPKKVLITNDNGINDIKIIELAKSFSRFAETVIVAAEEDKSGTSNFMQSFRTGSIKVTKRNIGENITAYSVDGFPADCVLWGTLGLMKDSLPDLVVSGINGGPNLAEDWFGSGTIGAARTAALLGIPAIAVSGLDDSDSVMMRKANEWVVELAKSPWVRNMKPMQYLTVSLPLIPADQIRGVKVVERAWGTRTLSFEVAEKAGKSSTWRPAMEATKHNKPDLDTTEYANNYIVVVPMSVNENDLKALEELRASKATALPAWAK